MSPSIQFCGAARTVTGSKHLLEIEGKKILVDCGIFQGSRELNQLNRQPFLFDPTEIDMVVITHAHNDHIGMLPVLVKQGYEGKFIATPATIAISKISLPDSGRIQEEDAKFHNKHKTSSHDPALPLFTENDAFETLKHFQPLRYNTWMDLPGGAKLRFIPAGHILGSAMAEIYFRNGEHILMGGDLGRYDQPIITDPTAVDFAEYLVLESTYGDRLHGVDHPKEILAGVLEEAMKTGGCVITPSFSIGRTQELLYYVSELQIEGRIPRVPIYLDSPMAVAATDVYDRTIEDHDVDMKNYQSQGFDMLSPNYLEVIRDRNQSKMLNSRKGPMMIIAGSGMANGGRVVHHLMHRLSDPSTIVLFSGYQGGGTLGRQILDGAEVVKIYGQEVEVRASVRQITSLSAHADQSEIIKWCGFFKTPPKKTFLVHGDYDVQQVLAGKLKELYGWNIEIPEMGDRVEL